MIVDKHELPSRPDRERPVLTAALATLRDLGLDAELLGRELPLKQGGRADARLRLIRGKTTFEPWVEVKRHVTPATLGSVTEQVRRLGPGAMLLLDYATPPVAERLKALGIPFADAAGNVWLDHPPLLIWVTGRKPPEEFRRAAPTGRAYQESGLKLLFALLNRPELIGRPYRELAQFARVANGTVGWVMADLAKQRHLALFGKGKQVIRKLRDRRRLLDDWCVAYARTLRPKLAITRCRGERRPWWREVDFRRYGMRLGGEAAAARMTNYLQPATVTLYVESERQPHQFMLDQRLTRAPDGEVEFLEKFWTFEAEHENGDFAPPILVYADLLATGDPRCLETARLIYDEHLARFFDAD